MPFKLSPETAENWKRGRAALRSGEDRVNFHWYLETCIPGTSAVVAMTTWAPYPIAWLYFRPIIKGVWELLYISVTDQLRRAGVGSKLHAELLRGAEVNRIRAIYTQAVSSAGAAALLKTAGYQQRDDGYWLELAKRKVGA